jgi:opacity protein-like surface antigen
MNELTLRRALPGLLCLSGCLHAVASEPTSPTGSLPIMAGLAFNTPQDAAPRGATRPSAPIVDDLYFLADVGVAIPQDVSLRNISASDTSTGLSGAKLSLDPGVRFDLGLGYKFTDAFAIELASGLIWNRVDKVEGTLTDTTTGFIGTDLPLEGGSGNVYNIPIMFNAQGRFPVGKDMKLVLGVGIGALWSDASITGVNSPLAPGILASVDGDSWAFAYQANAGLEWVLASNLTLGVRYAFLGTTDLNYGPASFNTPLAVGTEDIRANALYTHSILATLRLKF